MKLQQKIFGIGLLTAVIVPHLYKKGYMSAGRIPVFIDTNRPLPELRGMKWEDFCVIVPFSEVHRVGDYIQAFHDKLSDDDFAEACRKSRAAFEQLLPHNFVLTMLEIIAKNTN
jgi:hypothetical protein